MPCVGKPCLEGGTTHKEEPGVRKLCLGVLSERDLGATPADGPGPAQEVWAGRRRAGRSKRAALPQHRGSSWGHYWEGLGGERGRELVRDLLSRRLSGGGVEVSGIRVQRRGPGALRGGAGAPRTRHQAPLQGESRAALSTLGLSHWGECPRTPEVPFPHPLSTPTFPLRRPKSLFQARNEQVCPVKNNPTKEANVLQGSILLSGSRDHALGVAVAPPPQTVLMGRDAEPAFSQRPRQSRPSLGFLLVHWGSRGSLSGETFRSASRASAD